MVLLQHRLNLKVSQKQILTPGLVQMVSVLALNKLELKDMINEEMVENPVLDEYIDSVPTLDEVAAKEEQRERESAAEEAPADKKEADPFDEIDFGSFFQEYLDPGYRSSSEMESIEKPSFENFLSQPTTLTDHLMWQLGAMNVKNDVRAAAELVIGNLNEDGYLLASDEELIEMASYDAETQLQPTPNLDKAPVAKPRYGQAGYFEARAAQDAAKSAALDASEAADLASINERYASQHAAEYDGAAIEAELNVAEAELADDTNEFVVACEVTDLAAAKLQSDLANFSEAVAAPAESGDEVGEAAVHAAAVTDSRTCSMMLLRKPEHPSKATFGRDALAEAMDLVRQMDPVGVACRTLSECLLAQLEYLRTHHHERKNGSDPAGLELVEDAIVIVRDHTHLLLNKAHRDISKIINRTFERVLLACDLLKTLDPKPGLRYNKVAPRLIEPDVAVIKQGDEYFAFMNDDDLPQLRLNPTYKKLLGRESAEKDVRNYVKERYKSAIQLIKNIEQRKQTILKVCYAIIGRQREFLDFGIDYLKPMMIKEVAEEIGVHPSTVSRAVANKYAHTPQGVFELRYFFSESVNGPEGGGTSLLILKRRVKKLIEEEDSSRPLTDEQITRILQSQGIQVTRRTVAKYREDMKIPSTHQRRIKK